MSLVLSPATEARIQAELATGRYAAPDELLNRALDLLEAETEPDDWLSANKDAVRAMLDERRVAHIWKTGAPSIRRALWRMGGFLAAAGRSGAQRND